VKLLQGLVDHKRRNNKKEKQQMKKDMMDLLMEVKDEESGMLQDEDIVDLLLLFLLAGHESSAYGVLWTVIYLTNHPHVFERAKVLILIHSLWEKVHIYTYFNVAFKISHRCHRIFSKKNYEPFQKEQDEIMETRPSTQKGLNLMEIKQMKYLSKVCDV
jgi:ent-kaurenoic acid monooxygenase